MAIASQKNHPMWCCCDGTFPSEMVKN